MTRLARIPHSFHDWLMVLQAPAWLAGCRRPALRRPQAGATSGELTRTLSTKLTTPTRASRIAAANPVRRQRRARSRMPGRARLRLASGEGGRGDGLAGSLTAQRRRQLIGVA